LLNKQCSDMFRLFENWPEFPTTDQGFAVFRLENEGELKDTTFVRMASQGYRSIMQKYAQEEAEHVPLERRLTPSTTDKFRRVIVLYCEINRIFDYGTQHQWLVPLSIMGTHSFGGDIKFPEELITRDFLENDIRSVEFSNMGKYTKHYFQLI